MATFTYFGRVKRPLRDKLNPIWWVLNSDDPPPSGYTALTWWLRNPFHNLTFYVIGVADRNYTVYGREPAGLAVRKDIGERGWQWSAILAGGWLPLPWLSYTGTRVLWYAGWQPTGKLGLKFNIMKGD